MMEKKNTINIHSSKGELYKKSFVCRSFGKLFLVTLFIFIFSVAAIPFDMFYGISENYGVAESYGLTTGMVTAKPSGTVKGIQGDQDVQVSLTLENGYGTTKAISNMQLKCDGRGITIAQNNGSVLIPAGGSQTVTFLLDIAGNADVGEQGCVFTADVYNESMSKKDSTGTGGSFPFKVYTKLAPPPETSDNGYIYTANEDINFSIEPEEGFRVGNGNKLKLEVYNYGNTAILGGEVVVTLPEGLSISRASNSVSLGNFSVGTNKKMSFPITVADSAASKNYSVDVEVRGKDYKNAAVSIKKTFYIPVLGATEANSKELNITNVSMPSEVSGESDFKLTFNVTNGGKSTVKNMKIFTEAPDGLINKTKNIFVEKSFAPGETKAYSVTYFSKDTTEKTYPIKIAAESLEGGKEATSAAMQYVSVYVKSGDNSITKTPQLMISGYNFGGTYVQAGTKFRLNMTLANTSNKTLSNIKVSLSSGEAGTFVPVQGSNSLFVDSIKKKGKLDQSLLFSVKRDAKQETTAMQVDMTYEDGAGNTFTSKDTISIPVMQESRLAVDDIVEPADLFVANPASVSVQFYNMGKTTLSNLRATAYGDFDTIESLNYFVGNMDPGKSDTYDFTILPRRAGMLSGAVVFTYEDASGNEQRFEKPFDFTVMGEMPTTEPDPGAGNSDGGQMKILPFTIGGIIILVAAAAIIVMRKIRRKKKQTELEIDE